MEAKVSLDIECNENDINILKLFSVGEITLKGIETNEWFLAGRVARYVHFD
jgi:hypothetical protein